MHSIVTAKAAIQNTNGDILLLQRSATDNRRPLEWDLPGGGIEPGEDITQGIIREIYEEVHLTIDVNMLSGCLLITPTFDMRLMHEYISGKHS